MTGAGAIFGDIRSYGAQKGDFGPSGHLVDRLGPLEPRRGKTQGQDRNLGHQGFPLGSLGSLELAPVLEREKERDSSSSSDINSMSVTGSIIEAGRCS